VSTFISLQTTPERLIPILKHRYSSQVGWSYFRSLDFDALCCHCLESIGDCSIECKELCRSLELFAIGCYYMGDYGLAIDMLETISTYCSTHPICQLIVAESFFRSGNSSLGLELLQQARIAADERAELLILVAGSFQSFGLSRLSMESARRACELDPDSSEYLIDLSYYHYKVFGFSSSSVALAQRAVELDPDVAGHRVRLATFHLAADESQKAYQQIRGLTSSQIAQLDCPCCVARIADLYLRFCDHERYSICLDLLQQKRWLQQKRRPFGKVWKAGVPASIKQLLSGVSHE
jgi:tetratricopeptide (TPR) repeat protein